MLVDLLKEDLPFVHQLCVFFFPGLFFTVVINSEQRSNRQGEMDRRQHSQGAHPPQSDGAHDKGHRLEQHDEQEDLCPIPLVTLGAFVEGGAQPFNQVRRQQNHPDGNNSTQDVDDAEGDLPIFT